MLDLREVIVHLFKNLRRNSGYPNTLLNMCRNSCVDFKFSWADRRYAIVQNIIPDATNYSELLDYVFQIIFSLLFPILRVGDAGKQPKRRVYTHAGEYRLRCRRVYPGELPEGGLNKIFDAGKCRDELSQGMPIGVYRHQVLCGYA